MTDEVFVKKWSTIIEKGYKNYIIPRVILGASLGVFGGVLTTWVSYITWNKGAFNSIMRYIGAASIGTVIGVIIASNSLWRTNEKRYFKFMSKNQKL
ncbi:hypothetical protein [Clostridium sp. HBUAS56017]|uniref:hypothetical protein n=1 Tax=Clostridium sp. HBUAS56017 TaxID=2571128 RepID=UPI00117880BE|nr:hypothetical protein [Clostridium sp. HBUAS56017]